MKEKATKWQKRGLEKTDLSVEHIRNKKKQLVRGTETKEIAVIDQNENPSKSSRHVKTDPTSCLWSQRKEKYGKTVTALKCQI